MRRFAPLLLIGLFCAPAWAGDFVDVRLNMTLGNENVLVKPGETNPSIPGWRFGRPTNFGILFFNNYDTRYSGFENLAHLVIYKKKDWGRATAEAAFLLRTAFFSDVNLSNIDAGSYIRVQSFFDKTRTNKTNIALTVFPMNSDRMRLGYSYRITWGGSPILFKFNPDIAVGSSAFISNTDPAPGLKLQLSGERYYVYVGGKTSTWLNRNPTVNEKEVIGGVLVGAGADVMKDHVRLEGNLGYFARGNNPLFYGTTVGPQNMTFPDFPLFTVGGGIQLSVYNRLSPSTSLDLSLYRNDPLSPMRFFQPPSYTPEVAWMVSTEFSMLGTALQDPNTQSTTRMQLAYAGDINLRVQKGGWRVRMDAETRSLSFILQNQPGLVPYQDFPDGSDYAIPEVFASAGFDYFFSRIGLQLGPQFGFMWPATFTPPPNQFQPAPIVGNMGGALSTPATIVVRNEGDISILPEGASATPIIAAQMEARLYFLEFFSTAVKILYQFDSNQTRYLTVADGTKARVFSQPNQLGFLFMLDARY